MSSSSAAATQTTNSPSPLAFKVVSTYLNPLLEKHEKGQHLVQEDLTASWQAAERLLKQNETALDFGAVKEKIAAMHKEQQQAYQQAAKQALQEYAKTVSLPAVQTMDQPQPVYVQHCLKTVLKQAPGWKIPRSSIVSLFQKIISERAVQLYKQSKKATTSPAIQEDATMTTAASAKPEKTTATKPLNAVAEDEEEEGEVGAGDDTGEEEDGEVEEHAEHEGGVEDEMEEEDGEVEEGEAEEKEAATTASATTVKVYNGSKAADANIAQKRKGQLAKKRAGAAGNKGGGKAAPRKKVDKVKAPGPKPGRGGNRRTARRGGRGGGGNAK